ncbi:ADP-ribosylation factor-like protein 6-interacting protein 1 [Leptotrombidium deliense]|uniref:ADP-ribosylation factor-like protein 6-interacting protein 1 n=1 Tax=Leptotrombidium deliense TaxID=299467 RepID=A0A443SIF8_9ACAR|nr:ADP-ribosylation factor-like protein 6-interacting protein 1 [Leptotrombidium deliense]
MTEIVPDSSDYNAEANLEQLSEKVKKQLFRWRQLMVFLHKFFIWEQQYYPIVLNAIVGVVFCSIWICDSSSTQEKVYNDICTELALGWVTLLSAWNSWQKIKDSKPKVYFIGFLTTLLVFAWIGNLINNLFLAYLMTTFIVLFPGLKHHGILQKYVGECIRMAQNSISKKKK